MLDFEATTIDLIFTNEMTSKKQIKNYCLKDSHPSFLNRGDICYNSILI